MNTFQSDVVTLNTLQDDLLFRAVPTETKRHPAESYAMNDFAPGESNNRKIEAALFGTGYTMHRDMDINTFSQIRRPPMFQSSFALLNSVTGDDDDIQIEDYLGAPTTATSNTIDVHKVMDTFYGY